MKHRKAALGFIFVTILIDVTGFGIIIPVVPGLISELSGGTISDAARYGGWLMFVYAFMQFLFSPILGGLSDQFGRRSVLLASLFGLAIDYTITAFAPTLIWLFAARFIAGIGGASFTTATAYIADISKPEDRAKNFGMIGAAFGLGFILGPVIGGLLGELGTRIPFFAAAGLTLLNFLYGYFIIPESLSKENRRPFSWKRANPVGTLMQLRNYPLIVGLLSVLFLLYVAAQATQSTWAFFTIERYKWSEAEVGYSLGFVGLMIALVQGFAIGKVVANFGQVKAVFLGLVFNAAGLLMIALATEGWMIYAIMVPYALGGLAGPTLQGIMSSQVKSSEQGELQGGITSMASITTIIGPPLMTSIFAYFTSQDNAIYHPGAPFFLGSFLALLALILAMRSLKNFDIHSRSTTNDPKP
jgi:MFS transporter, DHA1 family, tetracycline resistance protein